MTERQWTAPAVIWSKPLVAYGDKKLETFHKDDKNGGHFVFERDSERAREAGHPIRRFIRTAADQSDYCKRENLINPKELPNNLTVDKNGTGYETQNVSEV